MIKKINSRLYNVVALVGSVFKTFFFSLKTGFWKLSNLRDPLLPLHPLHSLFLQVSYMKKFLQSDAYKKAIVSKRPVYTEFGTKAYPDLTKNIFSRVISSVVSKN